jgi:hypothetical protein
LRALKFDDNTAYRHNVTGTALEITGDITVSVILLAENAPALDYVFAYTANAETEASNNLYCLRRLDNKETLGWFTEQGGGGDTTFTFEAATTTTAQLLTVVRDSNVVTLYIDGVQAGASSGSLTAPTGGTSAVFNIGAFGTTTSSAFTGAIACVKVIDSALTASQVFAEYETTWADAPSSSSGGGSSVDETQVALISQVFGS